MQILRDIAPYVALAAAAACVVLLVLLLVLWRGLRRVRRSQLVVMGRNEERDIVGHVESLDSQVRNLREAAEILTDQLDDHKRQLDRALTNRAILRYDAFRDAGGEQSASFALLDQYRSGVVFSAIAARDFARIYVKHLRNGVADRDLSPEEEQVVQLAVPHPLKAGERGRRAARAPLPEQLQHRPGNGRRPAAEAAADDAPADGPAEEQPAVVRQPTAAPEPAAHPLPEWSDEAAPDTARTLEQQRAADLAPPDPAPMEQARTEPDPMDVFDELWPPDEDHQSSH